MAKRIRFLPDSEDTVKVTPLSFQPQLPMGADDTAPYCMTVSFYNNNTPNTPSTFDHDEIAVWLPGHLVSDALRTIIASPVKKKGKTGSWFSVWELFAVVGYPMLKHRYIRQKPKGPEAYYEDHVVAEMESLIRKVQTAVRLYRQRELDGTLVSGPAEDQTQATRTLLRICNILEALGEHVEYVKDVSTILEIGTFCFTEKYFWFANMGSQSEDAQFYLDFRPRLITWPDTMVVTPEIIPCKKDGNTGDRSMGGSRTGGGRMGDNNTGQEATSEVDVDYVLPDPSQKDD